ncbi:hypothetical protein C5F48_23310 [Cereibacter changlensis JA139]|uniref:Uncharacterized protein n=2 Tax=Cereibacter changlensis TaxID=402884 RepID=A0A2T4JN99_9RHOB|nr:hypothetical protein C5F48_23310 [Cereibacter changlensis JA139]
MDGGTEAIRQRVEAVRNLGSAIAHCDRRDAVLILAAALDDLSGGAPAPAFVDAQGEAAIWAEAASSVELEACFRACLPKLEAGPLIRNAKKRLFMALWDSFSEGDRAAFLKRVCRK